MSDPNQHVEPVFILKKDLPPSLEPRFTTLDICLSCESVSGRETIVGCQQIRGLIRIYPNSRSARDVLLTSGVEIAGIAITVFDKNPYILRGGQESPATKVWIGDIPISVSGTDIESALVRVGCTLRSKLMFEKSRDRDGKLTRFLTGRRFIFISVPARPLEKELKIGSLTAVIYHKEQPRLHAVSRCGRCLQEGHRSAECSNDIVCRECKQPGHKQGDPTCGTVSDNDSTTSDESSNDEDEDEEYESTQEQSAVKSGTSEASSTAIHESSSKSLGVGDATSAAGENADSSADSSAPAAPAAPSTAGSRDERTSDTTEVTAKEKSRNSQKKDKKKKKKEEAERGRMKQLQTTLNFEPRQRSATPSKRQREEGDSPKQDDKVPRTS